MQKNLAQEEAMQTHNGQVLLISCPGSGKTTTMIRRIKAMIDAGIDAATIVMVTFTDAAANEMRTRFQKQYGDCAATFCTIHSLCLKTLMASSDAPLKIISAEDQFCKIKDCMRQARIPIAAYAAKDVLMDISAFKNSEVTMQSFKPATLSADEFARLYPLYEDSKRASGVIDFDDMLCLCREKLQSDTKLLSALQNRYRYIMCDEYQDTNSVQKDILYLLAGDNGNLCVVGDDDQSIYGFRGTTPGIMLNFKKDFPNVHEIHMDTNYRSRPQIIQMAKNLIEHNNERFKKDIKAARDGEGEVIVHTSELRENELEYLVETIRKQLKNGVDPKQIAILARTNLQLEDLAATLSKYGISYSAGEAIKDSYEHFIFRDIFSYLNLINGNWSMDDFLRILNRPNRYLKEANFRAMTEFTENTLVQAASKQTHYKQKAVDVVLEMFYHIQSLRNQSLASQVSSIIHRLGYCAYISDYAEKAEIEESLLLSKLDFFLAESIKYQNPQEWYRAAQAHVYAHRQTLRTKSENGVNLATMHRAKGLEWDIVYIVDCCKNTIPSSKAETSLELEEERRLFYVAMTRAKEKLYLLNYCKKEGKKGKITEVEPSLFLHEIKTDKYAERLKQEALDAKRKQNIANASEFLEGSPLFFSIGKTVTHKTYGTGIVTQKNMACIIVKFERGIKMFPLK